MSTGSVDMSALASELADYALENKTGIFSKIVNYAMPTWMTTLPNIADKVPLIECLVGDILQPGAKSTFNPSQGAVQYKNRYLQMRPAKADLQFTQEQISQMKKSWLGVLQKSQEGDAPLNVDNFPFEAYVYDKLTQRFGKNLATAIWKGTYNPTGTSKLDVVDGLLGIVDGDITSTAIPAANVFAGAAVTPSNAEAQFLGVAEKTLANEDYAGVPKVLLCAPENKYYYEVNYRENHGSLPYNLQFEQSRIPGFQIEILPIAEMTGSDRIIVSPAENFVFGFDDLARASQMVIEREKRNVNVMMDIEIGVNYAIAEVIWANDQD